MDEAKRPGGLTALAVLNFVFGGLGVLGLLGFVAIMAVISQTEVANEAQAEMKKAFDQAGIGLGFFAFIMVLSLLSSVLLITSGVGYLKQKKFLGRGLGNAYAILSIVSSVVSVLLLPAKHGGQFNLGTMVGLIYPVLTVILLNTTFKEDFVN